MQTTADRVRARMQDLGLNAHETALKAHLEKSYVSDLILGRKRSVRHDRLVALARVLQCDVEYLTGDQDVPRVTSSQVTSGVPFAGIVEPGAWRKADATQAAGAVFSIEPDQRFIGKEQRAYLARGAEMDPFGIEDGMLICTVDYRAFLADHILTPGDLVVTIKSRDDAHETQRSVMRVKYQAGRLLLVPPDPGQVHEGDDIVEGVVVRVIRVFSFAQ